MNVLAQVNKHPSWFCCPLLAENKPSVCLPEFSQVSLLEYRKRQREARRSGSKTECSSPVSTVPPLTVDAFPVAMETSAEAPASAAPCSSSSNSSSSTAVTTTTITVVKEAPPPPPPCEEADVQGERGERDGEGQWCVSLRCITSCLCWRAFFINVFNQFLFLDEC